MLENSKQYFYAGLFAIVFFSLIAGFAYVSFEDHTSDNYAAKITLAIQNENSGTESFSALINEEALFSDEQSILLLSSKESEGQSQVTCTINCQRIGD